MSLETILGVLGRLTFGSGGGLTYGELRRLTERSRFSEYIPWVGYDEEHRVYLNRDDTIGYCWECTPLAFAGAEIPQTLEGLFRIGFPEGSVMQFIVHADPHVEPFLARHRETKTRDCELVRFATEKFARFYAGGVAGFANLGGIPLRKFRLFVTVKMPVRGTGNINIEEIRDTVVDILSGAKLCPVPLDAGRLVDWARRLFNDVPSQNNAAYDDTIPLRKQVIFSETEIRKDMSSVRMGKKIFRCTTPKRYPPEVDPFQMNQLMGGVWGLSSDMDQIKTPFIHTLSVVFSSLKAAMHTKCNIVLQQQSAGSFAPSLARKKREYLWAVDEMEKGSKFVRVIPELFVYSEDEKEVKESIIRARRIWEDRGFIMQEDKGILPVLLLSAIPFGLINVGENVENLERDFIVPAETAARILPVQADFSGTGKPVLPFVGRKGNACGIDIFDSSATNHNIGIFAGSGNGKSVLVNYIVTNYYGGRAKIRLVDIGGSYKKTTTMFNAKYLDFTPDSNICLNPLSHISDPEYDLPMAVAVVSQMAYSSGKGEPTETEKTVLQNVIGWVHKDRGEDAVIDDLYEYLIAYKDHAVSNRMHPPEGIADTASGLAFNLQKFTRKGVYGRFFNGRSTVNIDDDEFVVLELEHLAGIPALFNVITLQVVNLVTQNLYLSDRDRPVFIIFDEAHQFFKKSQIIADAIETGYRRARKYGGSFSVITQSVLDLQKFGPVGDVIFANSAFKFLLGSTDFDKAKEEKVIDYDDFVLDVLKTVKTPRPKYSEIFMDTPNGLGVGRLVLGPWLYYLYTSDAKEIAEIEGYVKSGMTYIEAINEMVRVHHG